MIIWKCWRCWLEIENGAGYLERDSWASPARTRTFEGWRALHRECDREITNDTYWWAVERLRTEQNLIDAAEHMRSKQWWSEDEWQALLDSPLVTGLSSRVQSVTPAHSTPSAQGGQRGSTLESPAG